MTVRRRWTTDEDEQLRALWNSAPHGALFRNAWAVQPTP